MRSRWVSEGQCNTFSRPSTGSRYYDKSQAFIRRVTNLKVGYKGLGDALRQYAVQLKVEESNECDTRQRDVVDNKSLQEEKVGDEKVRFSGLL